MEHQFQWAAVYLIAAIGIVILLFMSDHVGLDSTGTPYNNFYSASKERMCCADCLQHSNDSSIDCRSVIQIRHCFLVFDQYPHTLGQCRDIP